MLLTAFGIAEVCQSFQLFLSFTDAVMAEALIGLLCQESGFSHGEGVDRRAEFSEIVTSFAGESR